MTCATASLRADRHQDSIPNRRRSRRRMGAPRGASAAPKGSRFSYEGLNLGRSGRACSGENQLRQGWDCVGAGDVQSRAEVIPKSNAQFEASFCQAQESVSAIATGVTAGAATDLSPCDLTANVIFRSVGVERDFGTVEHHEQLGLVFV